MHPPFVILNWPAIMIATLAAFIFGGVWYGPLFGLKWAKEIGMPTDKKPDKKVMQRAMIFQFLGLLLTSFVLAHSSLIWRPSVWGVGSDSPDYVYGFFAAFFTWVGFYIPMQLGKVSWEQKSWNLFAINAGHDFITLQIISMILAYWR
jgi:hypothetical protein